MTDWTLHRVRANDGPRLRALRLEALQDTPAAYCETYEAVCGLDPAAWSALAARCSQRGRQAMLAADTATGGWIGMMGAFIDDERDESDVVLPNPPVPPSARWAMVWGVFVQPQARSTGVADALLDAVTDWARDEAGVDWLGLQVGEHNARAIAFYGRHGFVSTEARSPNPLDPTRDELVMVRAL